MPSLNHEKCKYGGDLFHCFQIIFHFFVFPKLEHFMFEAGAAFSKGKSPKRLEKG